jgi:EmrB/QacA subfamily drug resistance transporter
VRRARPSQQHAVAVVYVAAMFVSIMDITIVNVALPTIGQRFHVTPASVDTIAIAFLVSLAVFMPASGWLGDRFGGKRVLLSAIILFTVASALCGLATSLTELVIFRILQGAGGGMLMPVGMAMLFRAFPPAERIRAASILAVPTALAPAVGPVLGGLLVTHFSWRDVFFVNVPIGIVAVAFGALTLRSTPEANPGRLDLGGFVLAALGLGSLMYGVSEGPFRSWGSTGVLVTIIAGAALLLAAVAYELRRAIPMVDLRQLRDRNFRVFTAVGFTTMATLLGTLYAVTLFFQDGRGMSALAAGLSTAPEAAGVMIGAQLVGRVLYPRLGPRRNLIVGTVGMVIFIAPLALVGATTNLWVPRLLLFAMGIFLGQAFVTTQAAAFTTISPAAMGRAATLFNALRQVGGAAGVAALTTVIVAVGARHLVDHRAVPDLTAYHAAFVAGAALALLSALGALAIDDGATRSAAPGNAEPESAAGELRSASASPA